MTLQSEEARERLQDHSLRDCEFHQKLLRTLKFGAQSWTRPTHKIEAQRISSPNEVLFTAISAASVVPASAVGMSSRLGEILTSIVHIGGSQTDSENQSLASQDFPDDHIARNGKDLEAATPSDTDTTSGVEEEGLDVLEPTRWFEIVSNIKVGVLSELDPKSKATSYLLPRARFQVKREHWVAGEKFLELSGGGFVSECSRKQRNKIVVAEVTRGRSTDAFVADALASIRTRDNYEM